MAEFENDKTPLILNEQTDKTNDPTEQDAFRQLIGIGTTFNVIYILNFFTAGVHAFNAAIILLVYMGTTDSSPSTDGDIRGPYIPNVCFNVATVDTPNQGGRPGFHVELEETIGAKNYLAIIVVSFFSLSAVCQIAQGIRKNKYKQRIEKNEVNLLRYIEYSLSASFMMVGIACTLMIYDVFTHILIFTCTFLCMLLGLIADYIRVLQTSLTEINTQVGDFNLNCTMSPMDCIKDLGHLKWFTHWLGWVAIMVPYLAVFAVNYVRSVSRISECMEDMPVDVDIPDVPPEVHLIVMGQFILFSIFGFVQYRQFSRKGDPKKIGIATEHSFIILSLVAKSLLGWLLAFNLLF